MPSIPSKPPPPPRVPASLGPSPAPPPRLLAAAAQTGTIASADVMTCVHHRQHQMAPPLVSCKRGLPGGFQNPVGNWIPAHVAGRQLAPVVLTTLKKNRKSTVNQFNPGRHYKEPRLPPWHNSVSSYCPVMRHVHTERVAEVSRLTG